MLLVGSICTAVGGLTAAFLIRLERALQVEKAGEGSVWDALMGGPLLLDAAKWAILLLPIALTMPIKNAKGAGGESHSWEVGLPVRFLVVMAWAVVCALVVHPALFG